MDYDLKKPCDNCPFRNDIKPYLSKTRVKEILHSIVYKQESFPCHKTSKFNEDGEIVYNNEREQHCGGALIFLERLNKPNQMMRIAERLRMYNRHELEMDLPHVYSSEKEMLCRHKID